MVQPVAGIWNGIYKRLGIHGVEHALVCRTPELLIQGPLPLHGNHTPGRLIKICRRKQMGLVPVGGSGMAHHGRAVHGEDKRVALKPETARQCRCHGKQLYTGNQLSGDRIGKRRKRLLRICRRNRHHAILAGRPGEQRPHMGENHGIQRRCRLRIPQRTHQRFYRLVYQDKQGLAHEPPAAIRDRRQRDGDRQHRKGSQQRL